MQDETLQRQCLELVKEWAEAQEVARMALIDAIHDAVEAGCTWRAIGMSAGLSEAGARLTAKRHPRPYLGR